MDHSYPYDTYATYGMFGTYGIYGTYYTYIWGVLLPYLQMVHISMELGSTSK
jgi:hypothetical protein